MNRLTDAQVRFHTVCFRAVILALGMVLVATSTLIGQEKSTPAPATRDANISQQAQVTGNQFTVRLGLAGVWKQGQACPVQFTPVGAHVLEGKAWSAEIATVDGDGVSVTYRQQLNFGKAAIGNDSSSSIKGNGRQASLPTAWMAIRIGRIDSPIVVRMFSNGQLAETLHISSEQQGLGLPATQPMVVAIGDSLGVEKTSRSNAAGGLPSFSVAVLRNGQDIPHTWQAYQACDLLVLACNDHTLLRSMDDLQWIAISKWLHQGGNCLISLGSDAEQLRDLAPLMKLLPGTIQGSVLRSNPGPLESFVSTDTPLPRFGCSLLKIERGVVDLSLLDDSNKRFPWWVRYSLGLGYVQLLASDLSSEHFQNWKDYRTLWQKILSTCWEHASAINSQSGNLGNSSFLGYDDLFGQLRATLDFFAQARGLTFGQMVAILLLILILIGPIDYVVCVRWLNRPSWSWLFAGCVIAISSAGLIGAHQFFRPHEVMVNSLEVLDVDTELGDARGLVWSHVYRATASRNDVHYILTQPSAPDHATTVRIDWLGLPGRGLGGLDSTITADRGLPGYVIDLGQGDSGKILGTAIPSAGTRSLQSQWLQSVPVAGRSALREPRGVDQLEGTLVNPMPFDLLDGVLVYRNWFYRLPTRIQPGQAIEITYEMVPKDLPRWLNRRKAVNGSEQATRWDPSDRQSPDRMMEVLLFHKAAGGPNYTSLENRFSPQVDLSKLLALDRAILFGRLANPLGKLVVGEESDQSLREGFHRAWCRVILPVAQTNRR